jgi:hypothetical protein
MREMVVSYEMTRKNRRIEEEDMLLTLNELGKGRKKKNSFR